MSLEPEGWGVIGLTVFMAVPIWMELSVLERRRCQDDPTDWRLWFEGLGSATWLSQPADPKRERRRGKLLLARRMREASSPWPAEGEEATG